MMTLYVFRRVPSLRQFLGRLPLAGVFILCPFFSASSPPAGYSTLAALLTITVGLNRGGAYGSRLIIDKHLQVELVY